MSHAEAVRFTQADRRLGIVSAWSIVGLGSAYSAVLGTGLLTLESAVEPIRDPWFTAMEILILVMAPAMVALMAAVHAYSPPESRTTSLVALSFMTLAAGLTAIVHFSILTLSRQPAFADLAAWPLLFSFTWPSLAYALDILAWDVLFALAMLFAAPTFRDAGPAAAIRVTMIASAVLALAGLAGVATGDMQLRNIGIVGYLGLFMVVAVLLGRLFQRTTPNRREERL